MTAESWTEFDQNVLDILSRFRAHRVAVTADIESAFLMISVTSTDHEFLCFLYMDDPSKEDPNVPQVRLGRNQEPCNGEQKVLGKNWNVSSDQIVFSLDKLAKCARTFEPTKKTASPDWEILQPSRVSCTSSGEVQGVHACIV